MALINQWHMESSDFVLAFPQAPAQTDIYMKPPCVPPDFTSLIFWNCLTTLQKYIS